jgi:hypothetical protein
MENKIKKEREVVTKDNYKQVVLKRAIILCWVLLGICFIVKIFGGNFFNIVCNNERFISVCHFIDTSIIRYFIYYLTFIYSMLMLYLIVKPKTSKKNLLLYLLVISLLWVLKLIVEIFNIYINIVFANIMLFVITYLIVFLFTKKPLQSLFVIGYDFVLTLVSAIIKNIGITNAISDYFIIDIIFLIDYYILLTITMLYRKIKTNKEA